MTKEEELDRKRAEMMTNAKWRQELREANVKRYSEQDEKEKELLKKSHEVHTGDAFLK